MKLIKFKILILLFVFTFLLSAKVTYACRTVRPSTTAMVENAEVIVRVQAGEYVEEPKGDIRDLNEPSNATINFKVKETLKGDTVPSEIILNGYLSDRDDFNDRKVPYDFVRPGGRGGSCSAYEYKKGAEFLLFLKKTGEKYIVRWYALAPTNEQLRSSDDEWITWVRSYLKSLKGKKRAKDNGAIEQFNGREGETATLLSSSCVKPKLVCSRFRPTSSHSFGVCLER